MSRTFTDVWKEASELSDKDRADLAGLLIESLEGEPDPDVEAAWAAEIERRLAELDAGTVKSIPWEQVRHRLVTRLNERSPCDAHMTANETVRALLDRLPDDCSLDDVLYHVYVVHAVGSGVVDAEAGRTIPHETVAADLRRKWLLGAGCGGGSGDVPRTRAHRP